MSEFELTLIRKRLVDAAIAKARRGELRISVPVGYVWSRDDGLMMDPDRRIQDAIRTIFRLFERLGSATQVLLHMRREGLLFPRPVDGECNAQLDVAVARIPECDLRPPESVLYAGAYAYGKAPGADGSSSTARFESSTAACRTNGEVDGAHARSSRSLRVVGNVRAQSRAPLRATRSVNGGELEVCTRRQGPDGRSASLPTLRADAASRVHRPLSQAPVHVPTADGRCTASSRASLVRRDATRPAIGAEILLVVEPLAVEAALVAEREPSRRSTSNAVPSNSSATSRVRREARRPSVRERRPRQPTGRRRARGPLERGHGASEGVRRSASRGHRRQTPAPSIQRRSSRSLGTWAPFWKSASSDMRTKQRLARALIIEEIVVDVDDTSARSSS